MSWTIEAEQRSYDAAKQCILATLECCDPSKHVFLNAVGSAWESSTGVPGNGEITVLLHDYAVATFGWAHGPLAEEQPA